MAKRRELTEAERYGEEVLQRILPSWLKTNGNLEIPRSAMRDYLTRAFCEGGLYAIRITRGSDANP